ncbi:cytochrome c maturation protein CcmE [Candidatus Methylocalor cossyra]|uniref:Cytochrome c-type biogenesis protein CcmE n=1 Tax=Candidatus Methylocalor cossyra TaxID=3108543 RepID=A0ABM9NIN8_9GAMM
MTPRRQRMIAVALILLGVSVAAFFALTALNKNLMYFYTPAQVVAGEAPQGYPFRVGGLVVRGSVQRDPNSTRVRFQVTDGTGTVAIVYDKALPDLFREGQGIISIGRMTEDGVFEASEVLAKHDENYMPPEVAESLQQSGQWPVDYKDFRK